MFRTFSLLLCSAALLAGCADEPTGLEPLTLRTVAIEDDVCPASRQVVQVSPGMGCGDYGSWLGEHLFAEGTPYLAGSGALPLGEMDTICRYRWGDAGEPSEVDIATLHTMPGATGLAGPDCEIAFAESSPNSAMSDAADQTLQAMFLADLGAMDEQDLGLSQTYLGRYPVVVATVDTMPNNPTGQPRSKHGESMGRVIEAVSCPGPSPCSVSTIRTLGLPRWAGGVDQGRGGYYGSHGDLAASIHEVTERWREISAMAPDAPRLVINLSVGWNPHVVGATGEAGEYAVHLALEEARCAGAAIIAAAGNRDGLGHSGATLPGGWEDEPAPTAGRCFDVAQQIPATDLAVGYGPLLHAVGGLDLSGDALPKGRLDGRPRLAAPADHVTVRARGKYTPPMTGTSLSAAGVSGLAALVWSFNPDMTANALMSTIYDAGASTGDDADFSLEGTAFGIRQVDACAALDDACARPQAVCPSIIDFTRCGQAGPSLSDLFDDFDTLDPVDADVGLGEDTVVCGEDGDERDLFTAEDVDVDCGESTSDPLAKFLAPQPGTHVCDACTLETTSDSAHVDASLNRDFSGATVEKLVVDVYLTDGTRRTYNFGDTVSLSSSTKTRIELRDLTSSDSIRSASVSTDLDQRRTSTDSLIVR